MEKQDLKDILWKLYQDEYTQVRHFDAQRSTVTNLFVIIAAAILAFVTYDKALTRTDIPLTVLLFILGLFGTIFTLKYHERAAYHYNRLREFRAKLDEMLSEPGLINNLHEQAREKHKRVFPVLYKWKYRGWKIHRLWTFLHLFLSLLGLVLTVIAAFWPQISSTP